MSNKEAKEKNNKKEVFRYFREFINIFSSFHVSSQHRLRLMQMHYHD